MTTKRERQSEHALDLIAPDPKKQKVNSSPNRTTITKWIPLANVPKDITYAQSLPIGDDTFILASENQYNTPNRVIQYDATANTWQQFIQYEEYLEISNPSIAYDAHSNKLYLSTSNTGEHKPYFQSGFGLDSLAPSVELLSVLDSLAPVLVNVNGTIHGIGPFGAAPLKHCIWNEDSFCFQHNHSFEEYNAYDNLTCGPLVHVPSKDILILVGGHVHPNSWLDEDKTVKQFGIWKCDLKCMKWSQIKSISFEGYMHSVALTSDEDNVIICGGRDKRRYFDVKAFYKQKSENRTMPRDKDVDAIWILNIKNDNWVLRRSEMACPEKGRCNVVRMGNEMKSKRIVCGWVRAEHKRSNIKMPTHIMQLIVSFYDQEMIHWVKCDDWRSDKRHFAINIKHIL